VGLTKQKTELDGPDAEKVMSQRCVGVMWRRCVYQGYVCVFLCEYVIVLVAVVIFCLGDDEYMITACCEHY